MALVCARRQDLVLELSHGVAVVHAAGRPEDVLFTSYWDDDERLLSIILELNHGCCQLGAKWVAHFYGRYAFLSNMAPCAMEYEGMRYRSVEAAFQAAKTLDPDERVPFTQMDGRQAKGSGHELVLRPDWGQVKGDIMLQLVRYKFRHNPQMAEQLKGTGTSLLIEGNRWHDNEYGNCTCGRPKCASQPGVNLLGKILMQVRVELNGGTKV